MSTPRWDQADLIGRVGRALEVADQTLHILFDAGSTGTEVTAVPEKGFLREKVVAETAMLLLCAEPVRHLAPRIRDLFASVAVGLVPHARHKDVLGAICLDPGLARDYAVAHAILSRLGYPDRDVDGLLAQCRSLGNDFGPERLPHRRLELEWLDRVWRVGAPHPRRDAGRLLADSMLGRPLDALGATRLDIYAFTHAVMYASDLGARRLTLPRRSAAIAADADAALAYGLDANDFDLVAEVVLTWPMLRLPWSPAAVFAFQILCRTEDELGFLPGSAFDRARYEGLTGDQRTRFALLTSYHPTYVMGFLCAAALRRDSAPSAAVPIGRRSRGAGSAMLELTTRSAASCWTDAFTALTPRQQDAVAPVALAVVLRRARTTGDLALIRAALEIALAHDIVDGPAATQAAALLRRSQALKL